MAGSNNSYLQRLLAIASNYTQRSGEPGPSDNECLRILAEAGENAGPITISEISDMSADARTRNTKTDAELKTLLGIGGAPTAINSASNVKFGLTVGGSITHALPASPAAGDRAKYYVKPTGTKTLDFDAAILRPSDSGLSLPKTMTDGKTYIVLMEYNGTAWMLVSLVGGY